MKVYRLLLKNYRVFEDELDIEFPSGLVGVYGANGAGKSYLIEAIPWTLYGRTRTAVSDVRTSGSGGECVTEVEFEHEDHHYRVRRTISSRGIVKARAWVDEDLVCDGVKESNKFVYSVLGMDVDAFKASVFAEQKQMAAFSEASPAERQRLVLSLLGVTPLDKARDLARTDARTQLDQLRMARAALPDVDTLKEESERAALAAGEAEKEGRSLASRMEVLLRNAASADSEFKRVEAVRIRRDQVIAVGKEKKSFFEDLKGQIDVAEAKRARLAQVLAEMGELGNTSEEIDRLEKMVENLRGKKSKFGDAVAARTELNELLARGPVSDLNELNTLYLRRCKEYQHADSENSETALRLKEVEIALSAKSTSLSSADAYLKQLEELGREALCPACGQELGAQFEAHLGDQRADRASLEADVAELAAKTKELKRDLSIASAQRVQAEEARKALERIIPRVESLSGLLEGIGSSDQCKFDEDGYLAAERSLSLARRNHSNYVALDAERRALEGLLRDADPKLAKYRELGNEISRLRDELHSLAFSVDEYDCLENENKAIEKQLAEAKELVELNNVERAQLRSAAETAASLLAQALESHNYISSQQREAERIARVADYLHEFRRSVISVLAPRLATSAANLFSELVESEYDQLEVDTASWQIKITDSGTSHDLARFSGSERDLANLAFRIAISEQIGHSFGRQVGLLVLDEVFGPLDDQRKFIMLSALDRLRARFNQVLVVTHGVEIKEQMPCAIEVIKLGQRRSTCRIA